MFDRYVDAKSAKNRGWLSIMLVASISLHGVVLTGVMLYSFWQIEKLTPAIAVTFTSAKMAVTPPPPPPPPPPKRKKKTKTTEVKKIKPPREIVQPPDEPPEPEEEESDEDEEGEDDGEEGGEEGGVLGGVVGGVKGGVLGGVLGGVGTGPPPPKVVPAVLLRGHKLSGVEPTLPKPVIAQLAARGVKRHIVVLYYCLTVSGSMNKLKFIKKSGFPTADAKILRDMGTWRFKPYRVKGKAIPICTTHSLVYQLSK